MKKVLLGILAVVVIAVAAILLFFKNDAKDPYADAKKSSKNNK